VLGKLQECEDASELHGCGVPRSTQFALPLQADVGDPQTVSNSLAPFLSLATAVTGAPEPLPAASAAQPATSASDAAAAGVHTYIQQVALITIIMTSTAPVLALAACTGKPQLTIIAAT